jgi:hypothetical protein
VKVALMRIAVAGIIDGIVSESKKLWDKKREA